MADARNGMVYTSFGEAIKDCDYSTVKQNDGPRGENG